MGHDLPTTDTQPTTVDSQQATMTDSTMMNGVESPATDTPQPDASMHQTSQQKTAPPVKTRQQPPQNAAKPIKYSQ
ncbi:unnamed protein product [Absidia cylindrospora]